MRQKIFLLILFLFSSPGWAELYVSVGMSPVSFSAGEFDRDYKVNDSTYKVVEVGTSSENFDFFGFFESESQEDVSNMFLSLGIKDWVFGYETGGIKGRIVGDEGTDFGSFEDDYKAYYLYPRKSSDDFNFGYTVVDYSMPYLFGVGDAYGNDLPAFQDEQVRYLSAGIYVEYQPVRRTLREISEGKISGKNDWYFMTRAAYVLTQAEASDSFKQALNTQDATWYGFGQIAHYELGLFHASKMGGASYTAQIGYFLRAHQYLLNLQNMFETDLGEGVVSPPEAGHYLTGIGAKFSMVW